MLTVTVVMIVVGRGRVEKQYYLYSRTEWSFRYNSDRLQIRYGVTSSDNVECILDSTHDDFSSGRS